jgi:DNA polymerase delta subunit 4|uniref:DNA polymerase delta subunit 4 n=1 Tax=Tetraselmis chuii TaxID=63592 RepID=A0A7S1T1A7_9CHLO|mmetsp:Transcript_39172/g.70157  ORF Transcript_39172/g.70157 Transcript_39172/m.70157 type:complete len:119 (+) Transcript_39172:314-670(+)|eukprot:CAMPEP_0177751312 /NCGR_PEP_ID=MMETSP0491_2-20121128/306_1 /TAXON_ID=63592 /ORGANISM="Tetraselmis chuii, Strain PLY429" /LENGTH=118 /DNA_ID=CAMNT_0019266415 /DNA_START=289 /DNA_END=645 /DNA_ORIENTATION=-
MSTKRISSLYNQQKKATDLSVHKGGVSKKENLSTERADDAKNDAKLLEERDLTLKKFDLATKYGPCIGMTRLERWERASELGLSPPKDVRNILEELISNSDKGHDELSENHCLWKDRI